jgi:hypothetical protein
MSYETFYKISETFENDLRKFEQDNNAGAWYLRYIAGFFAFAAAYFFAHYLGDHERTIVSAIGVVFAAVFFLYGAFMWREVTVWGLAGVVIYVAITQTSPVVLAIIFGAALIAWAIRSKK